MILPPRTVKSMPTSFFFMNPAVPVYNASLYETTVIRPKQNNMDPNSGPKFSACTPDARYPNPPHPMAIPAKIDERISLVMSVSCKSLQTYIKTCVYMPNNT